MRLLAMLLMFMPSIHQPSLFCQKQICHSKTAIKLTWCSLSHPLIKGRYPVYGLASGSGVSSQPPCIILTWGCCDMSATGWESMKRWRFAALLRFCDERQRCLLFTSSWRMWVRSLRSSPLRWAAVWGQFLEGVLELWLARGQEIWQVINYSWKLFLHLVV